MFKCATKRDMMHNRRGHGSTFDLLFKQRGRSLLFSELQSTPCLENKWGFVLRLAPFVLSCKPSTALGGARGDVCATLVGGALLGAVWFRNPPPTTTQTSNCGSWLYQQRFHACVDPSEMGQFSRLLTCRNILTPTQACRALKRACLLPQASPGFS